MSRDIELVVKLSMDLSAAFRGAAAPVQAAAQLEAVCDVLKKHDAGITPKDYNLGATFTGNDMGYYTVFATDQAAAKNIARELRVLPGVEAAYIKPPAALP